MTLQKNAQVRADLDTADAIVRAVGNNVIATEPTYVMRDLIVIELEKAREAEREACARIAEARTKDAERGTWQAQEGLIIAADIRART